MFGNDRKTIGVFVTQEYNESQKILTRGICMRAKDLGYNVAFFTNFLAYDEVEYEKGERSIADLPEYDDLEGIILLQDIWYAVKCLDKVQDNIKKFSKCPVVSVHQQFDEYYNVLINDDAVLDEIIRHFIEKHGYKKINFLTGPKQKTASIQRRDAFKRIMAEHNLPVEEERIFWGDFWKYRAKDAVEYWLSDPRLWPEAIICANDYMAIAVCNALAERGLSVPDDIAVSGCDNLSMTQDFAPTITTAGLPLFDMGVEAVNKIYKHNKGISQEQNSYMDTVTKIRESCGCKKQRYADLSISRKNRMVNEMEDREKDISANAFMSIELTSVKTIEELDRKLVPYFRLNEGFTSFYMCLNKNWDFYNKDFLPEQKESKDMIMEVGIKNGRLLDKEEFIRPTLLPASCVDSEPQFFLFNILHYQEVCFGYTAISYNGYDVYKSSYQGWLINICNALEDIRVHNELNRLVYKLEDMYVKDALTDLYNRRALNTLGQKYLKQCIEENSKLMVFTADLDRLKYINDNYGHAGGDLAIKTIADALKYAAEDDEICMRVGGDEFVVVGMDYDQKKMESFLRKFNEKIDRFNENNTHSFKVQVSCGWNIVNPNKMITIEDCMIVADSKMYQEKYEKKAIRLKQMGEFKDEDTI